MAGATAYKAQTSSLEDRGTWTYLAALLIVVAGVLAYSDGFRGPFVLDDLPGISENASTQDLWAAWSPPPQGQTVTGRPLVNFSLALNYAFNVRMGRDGYAVESYHLFNLLVHLAAGLALFGLVRRTLAMPRLKEQFASAALPVAFTAALIWTVHPLETEAVSYVIQRAEAMMALFYLLTLYCFARASEPKAVGVARFIWQSASVAACLLGMMCKEVMVSAPLMVLLYDRTFVTGNFWEALKKRWLSYAALACTWLVLARLVHDAGTRGNSAGFVGWPVWPAKTGLSTGALASYFADLRDYFETNVWAYTQWQFGAALRYLRLALWPHPLALDYGRELGGNPGPVALQAAIVASLVVLTLWALWKRPMLGFFGAWFFMILAPSSSIVPVITQRMAEHRMYLPMAGLVTLVVAGAHVIGGQRLLRLFWPLAAALLWLTCLRNADYATAVRIWSDDAAKQPENPRAFANLGIGLMGQNRKTEAVAAYETALRMKPDYPDAQSNYANALAETGRSEEAVVHYRMALALANLQAIHYNLGNTLTGLGRLDEAKKEFQDAVALRPGFFSAYNNLGNVLKQMGDINGAISAYQAALGIKPDFAIARYNLGTAYLNDDKPDLAAPQFLEAIKVDPGYVAAYFMLGNAMVMLNRLDDAEKVYLKTLQLAPDVSDVHNNYGTCLLRMNRTTDAIAEYREAVRLAPNNANAKTNLAETLKKAGLAN